jgi:hypothetical protein
MLASGTAGRSSVSRNDLLDSRFRGNDDRLLPNVGSAAENAFGEDLLDFRERANDDGGSAGCFVGDLSLVR